MCALGVDKYARLVVPALPTFWAEIPRMKSWRFYGVTSNVLWHSQGNIRTTSYSTVQWYSSYPVIPHPRLETSSSNAVITHGPLGSTQALRTL